ncbi:MAG: PilZ domain-containing protein [Erythrobacter sp.]|nr:PilZ domain-containing protein [Erythrobacter sp.]MDZ4272536.1 PilZ domain-containing protein [Erythrobacter sp.]
MKARRSARVSTTTTGSCRTARGMQWDIMLADLSQGGCRIEDPQGRLRLGEYVRLYIAGTGPHVAEVAWRQGAWIGLEFARPLPERVLIGLTAADGSDLAPVRRVL